MILRSGRTPRGLEQILNSGGTSIVSICMLKAYSPAFVGVFGTLTTVGHLLMLYAAARYVTPAVRRIYAAQDSPIEVHGGKLFLLAMSFVCVAATAWAANGDLTATLPSLLVTILAFSAYLFSLLLFDLSRRLAAVAQEHDGLWWMLIAPGLRIALALAIVVGGGSALLFLCGITMANLLGTVVNSTGIVWRSGQPKDSPPQAVVVSETVAAWAPTSLPVMLLALVYGPAAVSVLIAARTPVSLLNVAFEYIEVHLRSSRRVIDLFTRSDLLTNGLPIFLLVFAGWAIVGGLIYAAAPAILSLVANEAYADRGLELALFWMLQFFVLLDRLSFVGSRVLLPNRVQVGLSAKSFLLGLAVAVLLVYFYGPAGAIAAICLWLLLGGAARIWSIRSMLSEAASPEQR